jgi:thioredoxin reductase/NAD-dependent dihydropyrimidine dehydrogenase PreA subunit
MDPDILIIWSVGLLTMSVVTIPFYLSRRKVERASVEAENTAEHYGLHEPVTIHPVVHPGACIGTGSCISVCPEGDVLGLKNGQAVPIAPGRCIGHGVCERACPVHAIQLVFGTAKRGVDIPRIKQNFETNVPGLYIIGELGGMGLIRNAFEQGRQCIQGIAKERSKGPADALDVVILGAGPAGLSASLNCLHHKLKFVTVEREDIGGTVRYYPRKKVVMTAPLKVPGYGKLRHTEISKEHLIDLWGDIVRKTGLKIRTEEVVTSIEPTADGCFAVVTSKTTYKTKHAVLAIGRRGVPRKSKVSYSLLEPEAYQDEQIMVVGGGDSAVEAALALADQPENRVVVSYRRDAFNRIKAKNRDRVEAAQVEHQIEVLWQTQVTELTPDTVVYRDAQGRTHTRPNDSMFIFAGGRHRYQIRPTLAAARRRSYSQNSMSYFSHTMLR